MMEKQPTTKDVWKNDQWVRPFLKRYKKTLYFALLLGFLTFFSAGALMFTSGYLISRAASLPENILLIYIPIVLTRAFGIGRPVFRYVERLTSHNWVLKMTSDLRLKLYNVLEKDAIFFKTKYRTGDILGLLSEDINHIQNLYLRTIFPTVIAWILYIFLVIALGFFSWWFALCMLLMLGVVVFLLPLVSVLVNGARQEKHKYAKNELYQTLTDNILGVSDWIGAFVLTVFPLIDAFAPLPAAAQETTIYKDSIRRFNELPEGEDDSTEAPVQPNGTSLSIEHLSFAYENQEKKVLNDLSLTIPEKQKLAILGRSGSGKSTLASLIRGDLRPTSGEILLGNIPTEAFGETMTEYIGVMHQAPYLFRTTILNNIRIGREEASEAEVWAVLEKVGLKEMVAQLPEGLQTMVDEAGLRFSGGERHRLALARILLQDTPIVLLDEPTTGLDPITEQQLLETFFEALKDKTVIWITHHLQGVTLMDQVIFIEDGQLEMSGTPEELLATNAHYQKLYRIDRGISSFEE